MVQVACPVKVVHSRCVSVPYHPNFQFTVVSSLQHISDHCGVYIHVNIASDDEITVKTSICLNCLDVTEV